MDLKSIFAQKRANREADGIALPKAFTGKFPRMSRSKSEKLFRRYLDAVGEALLPKLPFLQDGQTYVSTEKLMKNAGEFQYQSRRYWVWHEFKDIYPFMVVTAKGSNLHGGANAFEKNTRVRIVNEDKLNLMLEGKSPKEVFDLLFNGVKWDEAADLADATGVPGHVEIDMDNLGRFIGSTYVELERATDAAHRAKLQRNIWQAELVFRVGRHSLTLNTEGMTFLPMVPAPSDFGRVYYRGLNIQNVSKQVRSAILGRHFQYDMKAAVFAIKLRLYGQAMGGDDVILGTTLGSYTRQYIAEKNAIRDRLARECFDGVSLSPEAAVRAMKNALTAVGFGARTSGKAWFADGQRQGTALADIILAPAARERFLADRWVKAFIAEQKVMEDAIIAMFKTSTQWPAIEQVVRAANAKGRVDRASIMSLIYQHKETELMDDAVAALARFDIAPLARIHDALIVRDKLPARVLDEISYGAFDLTSYMSFDCEEVREWIAPERKLALIGANADEAEHRARMERAEQEAAHYAFHTRKAGAA